MKTSSRHPPDPRAIAVDVVDARPALLSDLDVLPAVPLTENEFSDRIADAVPGQVITYYVGLLAHDRWAMSMKLPEPRRVELNAIANHALQLAEVGRVHLLQRRVGPGRFAYLAVVRPQPLRIAWRVVRPIADFALAEAA